MDTRKTKRHDNTHRRTAGWHKWTGLAACVLLTLSCLSGVVLNHRSAVSHIGVSREILPEAYRYEKWNNGLMRGTLAYRTSGMYIPGLFVYGNAGIWHGDRDGARFADFNRGLPKGADKRNVRGMAQTPSGHIFAITTGALYRYGRHSGWQPTPLRPAPGERLSDITTVGDTLVAAGRSYIYTSLPPYTSFRRVQLKAPDNHDGNVTLFRTVWTLHNGEMFGWAGRVFVDLMAVLLMLIAATGAMAFLMPRTTRMMKKDTRKAGRHTAATMLLHRRLGRATIALTLFVCATGWMLRPPMIALVASLRTPPIPGTTLHSDNPWHDKLRMVRHDDKAGDWLISTSDGFYSLATLEATPEKTGKEPPVSVMGLNVWQKDSQGRWLAGSFGGMYEWDRSSGQITDFFTRQTTDAHRGVPFGQHPVSGYSADFVGKAFAVDYRKGTDEVPQPREMAGLPMSLWAVAQEVHTGRIFTFLGKGSALYVFVAGSVAIAALWTGLRLTSRKRRKSRNGRRKDGRDGDKNRMPHRE